MIQFFSSNVSNTGAYNTGVNMPGATCKQRQRNYKEIKNDQLKPKTSFSKKERLKEINISN